MKKIVLIVLGLLVLGVASFFAYQSFVAKGAGEITIIIVDGEEVVNEKVTYYENDTLLLILDRNYTIVYEDDPVYGSYLIGIEGVITSEESQTYLALYHNDAYALAGVLDLAFQNGDVIKIVKEGW